MGPDRASDSNLKRQVALKVLPAALMADPIDIAAIYGIEEPDGVPALVMELVEGSTLADRILRTRSR